MAPLEMDFAHLRIEEDIRPLLYQFGIPYDTTATKEQMLQLLSAYGVPLAQVIWIKSDVEESPATPCGQPADQPKTALFAESKGSSASLFGPPKSIFFPSEDPYATIFGPPKSADSAALKDAAGSIFGLPKSAALPLEGLAGSIFGRPRASPPPRRTPRPRHSAHPEHFLRPVPVSLGPAARLTQ